MAEPSSHEVVIRFGRPFDIHTSRGVFLADVREITVPFADRESAEGAQREITVHVRPVRDAGGEDYRRVVHGEVVREPAAIPERVQLSGIASREVQPEYEPEQGGGTDG